MSKSGAEKIQFILNNHRVGSLAAAACHGLELPL